jgi:tRNA 2-thiocytidine biosynthesis protein TtcA
MLKELMETNFEVKKMVKSLRKKVWKAIEDFGVIQDGDKVMVCLSGGKDSYTMLDVLLFIQSTGKIKFDIVAVNLDQKQPGYPEEVLPNYLEEIGVEYKILEKNTYKIVVEKIPEGKTMCSLCSRLRRGNLYAYAKEIGANKVALGHHKDDVLETFMMNLFFGGKIETMPPIYKTDNTDLLVIRPLIYCEEDLIQEYSDVLKFPIIPCNLCGSQEHLQRKKVKKMLADWEKEYPKRKDIIFKSLSQIHPTHMLDANLMNFMEL